MGGLFTLAANLPAKGYELRFKEPVSVLQANSLSKAAEDLGLNLALWKEESETITTDLGRSSVAQRISVCGSPTLCFPAACLYRSAPGSRPVGWMCGQCRSGRCTFGSREVTGLELTVKGEKRCVTGVVEGKECFLICPDVTASDAGYTAASWKSRTETTPWNNTESSAKCRTFGKRHRAAANWHIASDYKCCRLDTIGVAALLFLHQLWRLAPLGKMGRQVAAFALLLMAALALPDLLAALPRWLVPSRWSDMNFWMDLGNLAKQSLMAFGSLTNSVRDQLLGTQILAFGGYLLGLLAGALLLGLKNCIENRCHHP